MATDHRYPFVFSSFALVLAACGGGGSGVNQRADSTPPTVVSTGPANAATGVPVDGTITATFSEPMAPASITEATFTVSGAGTSVSGIVSSSGATATFRPRGLLAFATTYTAAITRGATDVAANPLAASFSWTFTTPPPPA
ncbi:MAG: Ig-like domain-containing protein, partial [Deltaproteobacteria bacterium]